jgi:hypothetical protein
MKQMGTVVIQEEAGHEVIQVLSLLLLCKEKGTKESRDHYKQNSKPTKTIKTQIPSDQLTKTRSI